MTTSRTRRTSRRSIAVEEYPHAYLVTGTASVDKARKAVFKFLGGKKWTKVAAMPIRPFWNDGPCCALYFAAGPGGEQIYKP